MREIPVSIQAALDAQSLVTRDFMRITARDRVTGEPVSEAFWSGHRAVTAQVLDPQTGVAVSHQFFGAGDLISIDAIPGVSNLTIHRIGIVFNHISDRVDELLRKYDVKQAPIEIYRGVFNPDTMEMVAPAEPRFVGFIDDAPQEVPAEGQVGAVKMECVSNSQELTRKNTDTRSHESQQVRAPGDDFYKDTAAAGDKVIFWGRAKQALNTV